MSLQEQYIVTDKATAAALSRPNVARLFTPFMRAPCSLKTASDDLDVSMTALHYWVQRFLAFGVLRVERTERRAGRPVRHYQAVARRFVVPSELLPASAPARTEATWLDKFHAALEAAAPSLLHEGGLSLELADDGSLNFNTLHSDQSDFDPLAADQPAVLYTWSESLVLNHSDAKDLQRRLLTLFREYSERPEDFQTRRYIVLLGLAPSLE